METERAQPQSAHINQDKTMAIVRAMMGVTSGREDEDHPLPPGPWDPVIRIALERHSAASSSMAPWQKWGHGHRHEGSPMELIRGPSPEPWKSLLALLATRYPAIWEVVGGGPIYGQEVALNPQPLPPSPERFAFLAALAHTLTVRAELLQEIADATRREGEQQGIIIVSGYVARFADDICGNDFRFRWPFPGPRPHWFLHEINAIDLLVMAVHFEQAAKSTFSPSLRNELAGASKRLAEAGLAKV